MRTSVKLSRRSCCDTFEVDVHVSFRASLYLRTSTSPIVFRLSRAASRSESVELPVVIGSVVPCRKEMEKEAALATSKPASRVQAKLCCSNSVALRAAALFVVR